MGLLAQIPLMKESLSHIRVIDGYIPKNNIWGVMG